MTENGKIGLVLEGGGMRGIYTAGVLDVFMDKDLEFDGVIGVSAGAIHGGTFLAKQKGRNVRYYKKYCNDKRFMSIRNFILTGDVVGEKFCYHTLPEKLDPFDYEAFRQCGKEYYVTCSNIETGEAEYIKLTDLSKEMDYLRASASLPYVSKMVKIDGKKLMDGGCTDSIPVKAMLNMGYEKCVVVLTRHDGYVKKSEKMPFAKLLYGKYPNFIKAMENRHNVYNKTIKEIEQLEAAGKIFVVRPSEELTIGRMEGDAEKIQGVYDIGVKDAQKQMKLLEKWLAE